MMMRRFRNFWRPTLICICIGYLIFFSDSIFSGYKEEIEPVQEHLTVTESQKHEVNPKFKFVPNLSTVNMADCGSSPSEPQIKYDNEIWQVLEAPKGPLRLLNAYLDERAGDRVVRVNVNVGYSIYEEDLYCQFWFDGESVPTIVKAREYMYLWDRDYLPLPTTTLPYYINCPVGDKFPSAVSLTLQKCDNATNNLKIISNNPSGGKKTFTVCSGFVPLEKSEDIFRFIEWVQLLRILGTEKIYFHADRLSPEGETVVKHFETRGYTQMRTFRAPTGLNSTDASLKQNILNDCFNQARELYDVIFVMNVDEIVVPVYQSDMNWMDIIYKIDKDDLHDAYYSKSAVFPTTNVNVDSSVPKHLHILQHNQKADIQTNSVANVRSLIVPDATIVIQDHIAVECHFQKCRTSELPEGVSQTFVYRDTEEVYSQTTEDKVMTKYKQRVMDAVKETIETLKLSV